MALRYLYQYLGIYIRIYIPWDRHGIPPLQERIYPFRQVTLRCQDLARTINMRVSTTTHRLLCHVGYVKPYLIRLTENSSPYMMRIRNPHSIPWDDFRSHKVKHWTAAQPWKHVGIQVQQLSMTLAAWHTHACLDAR